MPSKNICFVCGEKEDGWESDYTFEDWGIDDRNGLVQCYTCLNCGADYEVYIEYPESDSLQDEEKDDAKEEERTDNISGLQR